MRQRGKRSAGLGRGIVLTSIAMATLVGAGLWPSAEATTSRAQQLDALLRAPAGESRKAQAIEELRNIDSSAARDELKDLADCSDDRVAMLAIRALGRANFSGAATPSLRLATDATGLFGITCKDPIMASDQGSLNRRRSALAA